LNQFGSVYLLATYAQCKANVIGRQ